MLIDIPVTWKRSSSMFQAPPSSPLRLLVGLLALSGFTPFAAAQAMDPFFADRYTFVDLGSVPGVPPLYGGLTLKFNDLNTLLIGGNANDKPGALYSITVIRDAENHISGFSGEAVRFADAAWNDGGVVYGPNSVLFLARWPINQLGQTRPGSTITDTIIDLAPFGVEESLSALQFVPPGYRGAGRLKFVTWELGQWLDVVITPVAGGTFGIVSITDVPDSRITGGPEGFVYVPPGSPSFEGEAMLVSEFSAGNIVAYDVDEQANPIVSTRRLFVSGLEGAEGAFLDPMTGDFLFSTFGGGDRVVAVRGLARPCRPDYNGDGRLNSQDFFDILSDFFASDPTADYNADNLLNTQDIFDYLNDFFTGCP
jgi:hypothetical protein